MGSGFAVHFHTPQVDVGPVDEVHGECSRARPDLHHRTVTTVVGERVGDGKRDTAVVQEVLPELLLGADLVHRGCTTSSKVRKAANLPSKCFLVSACRRSACSSR